MRRLVESLLAVLSCAVLVCSGGTEALGVELPDGAVEGLPERLTVMDSDGNSVDDTGEYYFYVEDMLPNTTYTKSVQIMNLREDQAYHVYFYAEPVSSEGDLDLLHQCTATVTLSGQERYVGLVDGEGSTDLTDTPLDLGLYTPGDSRTLVCSIVWDGDPEGSIDHGERLVDSDGTHTVREGSGSTHHYGEVTFKWRFYAVVDEDYTPPKTGVLAGGSHLLYLILLGVCLLLILVVVVMILVKRRRLSERNGTSR